MVMLANFSYVSQNFSMISFDQVWGETSLLFKDFSISLKFGGMMHSTMKQIAL